MTDGESPAGVESTDAATAEAAGSQEPAGADATSATDLPDRFEAAGIVIGCVLLGAFLAPLFVALLEPPGQQLFVPFALALGVIGGALIAYYDVLTYETVWSFTLGTWLAGVLLSVFQDQIRLGVLVVLDSYPTLVHYRVGVLVVALLAGYATSRLYAQLD